MKEHTRNTLVGLFVLAALGCLIVLILLFSKTPILPQETYDIEFLLADAGGVQPGDRVHLNGLAVGSVADVRFQKNIEDGVIVRVRLLKDVDLPRSYSLQLNGTAIGPTWAEFKRIPGPLPAEDQGRLYRKTGPPERVEGLGYAAYSLLPEDMRQALSKTAAALTGLLEPQPQAPGPATSQGTQPASQPANLATAVDRVARLAESLNQIAGDVENQQNIKDSLANLRQATAAAGEAVETLSKRISDAVEQFKGLTASAEGMFKTVGDAAQSTTRAVREDLGATLSRANELMAKFASDADELGKVLAGVRRATDDVAAGRGTVGKLLTDDALYQKLLDLVAGLQGTADELKTLVIQWRQEGIKVKF
jgi:ABC-type transporter Mla subunit MlaD